jgi:hypothetical protein
MLTARQLARLPLGVVRDRAAAGDVRAALLLVCVDGVGPGRLAGEWHGRPREES